MKRIAAMSLGGTPASRWELLLERGTFNEIRCALMEIAADDPQGDTLHWRLMEALEAAAERGVGAGKAIARQELAGGSSGAAPLGSLQ
jgi:hypothetical protein